MNEFSRPGSISTNSRTLLRSFMAGLVAFSCIVRLLPAVVFVATIPLAAVFAQQLDVAGEWHIRRSGTGDTDATIQQIGKLIRGRIHLGHFEGHLDGLVLTGTFGDIVSSGVITLTFTDDGRAFAGESSDGERWEGRRAGLSLADQLAERARLNEVQGSFSDNDSRAEAACGNLFDSAFSRDGQTWTTTSRTQQFSPPPLGAQRSAPLVWFQVTDVVRAKPIARQLSAAERLNGTEYRGSVNYTAGPMRHGIPGNWLPWQPVYGSLFTCKYEVVNGQTTLWAFVGGEAGRHLSELFPAPTDASPASAPPVEAAPTPAGPDLAVDDFQRNIARFSGKRVTVVGSAQCDTELQCHLRGGGYLRGGVGDLIFDTYRLNAEDRGWLLSRCGPQRKSGVAAQVTSGCYSVRIEGLVSSGTFAPDRVIPNK